MQNKTYLKYWITALLATLAAVSYPIYMGAVVVSQMIRYGGVEINSYPKYVIPYTPIAVAMLIGVLLIPLFQKLFKKFDTLFGTLFSLGVFYLVERLMETRIIIRAVDDLSNLTVQLESWQMSLCIASPSMYGTQSWKMVDVLLGGYSPAFKLHFYLISAVLIISLLNCFYGYAKMIKTGNYKRKKALIAQTVAALLFLGMCVWACFTAFYRTGEIKVPALSAVLLSVFFALLGITMGVFTASFTIGKRKALSLILPTAVSALVTLAMYIAEMCLLGKNLYRFGEGFPFDGLGPLVLSPVDLLVIFVSAFAAFGVCRLLNRKS